MFLYAACCDEVYLSRSLQMYSMGSSHQSTHFCVISVWKGEKIGQVGQQR